MDARKALATKKPTVRLDDPDIKDIPDDTPTPTKKVEDKTKKTVVAKKLNVKTVVFCDGIDAPAQNFCNQFINGKYDNKEKISEFINQVDLVTYEFENIPYETLNEINKFKPVLPKPSVNRLIQKILLII